MKKFSVPFDFGDIKHRITIYISNSYDGNGVSPIGFQLAWYEIVRGGLCPKEVINSLINLSNLALLNSVPFGDLTVYALKEAIAKQTEFSDAEIQQTLLASKQELIEKYLEQEISPQTEIDSFLKNFVKENRHKFKTPYLEGCMYKNGIGVEKNDDKAYLYLNQATKKNHASANYLLAELINHHDHEQDNINDSHRAELKKKYTYLLKAAMLGQEEAWYSIAVILDCDPFCKAIFDELLVKYKKQVKISRRSGKLDGEALTLVAFYKFILNVTKDLDAYQKIIHLYEEACEENYAAAYYQLGYHYQNGLGVTKDSNKAIKLFVKAAQFGHYYAQKAVAFAYQNGTLDNKSHDDFKWFEAAAAQGNKTAYYNLGTLYLNPGKMPDEKINYARAQVCFLQGAILEEEGCENENSTENDCYHKLAIYYQSNHKLIEDKKNGNINNLRLSYVWLLASIKKNQLAASMFDLGMIYKNGVLFARNYKKAFSLFELAAKCGNDNGKILTAFFLEKGLYVSKDLPKAIEIYSQFKNRSPLSAYRLARINQQGIGCLRDEKEAKSLYLQVYKIVKEFLDENNPLSMGISYYYLGLLSHFGNGSVSRDLATAIKYYTLAENSYYCSYLVLAQQLREQCKRLLAEELVMKLPSFPKPPLPSPSSSSLELKEIKIPFFKFTNLASPSLSGGPSSFAKPGVPASPHHLMPSKRSYQATSPLPLASGAFTQNRKNSLELPVSRYKDLPVFISMSQNCPSFLPLPPASVLHKAKTSKLNNDIIPSPTNPRSSALLPKSLEEQKNSPEASRPILDSKNLPVSIPLSQNCQGFLPMPKSSTGPGKNSLNLNNMLIGF